MKFCFSVLGLVFLLTSCSLDNVDKDNSLKKYFDENSVATVVLLPETIAK
jgi:hypothetical protein